MGAAERLGEQDQGAVRVGDGGPGPQPPLLFLTPLFSSSLLLLCFLKGVGELVSASEFLILFAGLARVLTLLSPS